MKTPLGAIALGIAVLGFGNAYSAIPLAGDPVATQSGRIAGTQLPSGVKGYFGIPFARAPVGALRWMPPQPLQWPGVLNADRFEPECIQILRPHDINHYFGEEASGEDCLYLNIWAPPNAAAKKLPVIVFIYGGGGTVGSSGNPLYGGEAIAANGAIFVNFNYRLGIFGFMAHPELTQQQGGHSGNYGYLDQNAALRWIHDNIAAFGGDPAKVLISGQSFGASSVAAHLFSPLSHGLYRAAAMWSACMFTAADISPAEVTLGTAEQTGIDIQHRLKAADLKAMRNIAADRILALQEEHQLGSNVSGVRLPPTVDGLFWPRSKQEAIASRQLEAVPLLVGSNTDDIDAARYPLILAKSTAEMKALAQKSYGAQAPEFMELFPKLADDAVAEAVHTAAMEGGFLRQSQNCAAIELKVNQSPTFIEVFAHKHPYAPGVEIADQNPAIIGAYHTADVPYWFGTMDVFNSLRVTRVWTPFDRDLAGKMQNALITMADTGSPSTSKVAWPAWTEARQQYLLLGDTLRVERMNVKRIDWLAAHPLSSASTTRSATTRD